MFVRAWRGMGWEGRGGDILLFLAGYRLRDFGGHGAGEDVAGSSGLDCSASPGIYWVWVSKTRCSEQGAAW